MKKKKLLVYIRKKSKNLLYRSKFKHDLFFMTAYGSSINLDDSNSNIPIDPMKR